MLADTVTAADLRALDRGANKYGARRGGRGSKQLALVA